MQEQVFVQGPLHPDLFDGESPIPLAVGADLQTYTVRVTYVVYEYEAEVLQVAATKEEEASRLALQVAESQAAWNECDFDAEEVEVLDRTPTVDEVQAWAKQTGYGSPLQEVT